MFVFFKKYPIILIVFLIFLVCILAYGQILDMYFFLEDYLILYSIQNPTSNDAGYGSGLFGRPFGYAVTPFIPFYYLFGLNPTGYYFIEIILYFFAAISVYYLAKILTNSTKVAFGSSIIFASGYVGSSTLYRMAVGWQNLLAAAFISLSAALYYKYTKLPKLRYYLLAFVVYLFTSEFSFYRAHGIILLIIGIELLFNFKPLKSFIRLIPFVISYWYFYVYSIPSMEQGSKITSFIQTVFTQRNYHYLLNPFKTLENLFVPDKFNFPLVFFAFILLGILTWKRSKILLFCLIFAIVNYLVYFYVSPENSQETTHRYLTISFIGTSVFTGLSLGEIFKSTRIYILFCALIVILNITLVRSEQANILENRSKPASEFWQSFRKNVKSIPARSVIYIDSKQDGTSKPARDAALGAGSMSPTTSFAVYYGLKWEDLYLAENFPELLYYIKSGRVDKNNVHTFFYSRQEGLVSTTEETKKNIFGQTNKIIISDLANINLGFHTPAVLNFYSQIDIELPKSNYIERQIDLPKYLDFLSSRMRYWNKVSITSTTEAEYAEIWKIYDQDKNTSWKGDDLSWNKNHKEEIIIDLGESRRIGAVKFLPAALTRIPTKYFYECSSDKSSWKKLASLEIKLEKSQPIIDKFESEICAFIKLTILGTISGGPPQISEIEILENDFINLDPELAEEIDKNPFKYGLENDKQLLLEYFTANGIRGEICIHTDKLIERFCKEYRFKIGFDNNASFFIDQGGTILKKIDFLLPEGIKAIISRSELEFQNLDHLEKMGYIAEKAY